MVSEDAPAPDEPLVEGRDYYVEGGYVVMTAGFLERRGWCCRNGCRHCPYGFGGRPATAREREEPPGQQRLPF